MPENQPREILIIGVTGTQGGAVARHLLGRGAKVRGLTRDADSPPARSLASAGVALVRGNLNEPPSVEAAIRGVQGVYLVTDFFKNGIPGEIRQGKTVADLCARLSIPHLVFASASGADRGSGVPHFESKGEIERHIQSLGIPSTVLRPTIFMEDLTDKKYFPPASWGMMPKLVGRDRPVKWISVDDIGAAAAAVFSRRDEFIGQAIPLVGDVLSIRQARETFARIQGKKPFALPMPTPLFRRFVSNDLVMMWSWLATHNMDGEVAATRTLVPGLKGMETWLRTRGLSSAGV